MRRLIMAMLAIIMVQISFSQDCSELFFSEYLEGSGNNKGFEIYNPTDNIIDLSKYYVALYRNGFSSYEEGGITQLQGFLLPFSTHLLINGQTYMTGTSPACEPELQIMADQLDHEYPAPTYMSGNDAVALLKTDDDNPDNAIMIDLIGHIGSGMIDAKNPEWTSKHSLVRKSWIRHGVRENPDPFIISSEWNLVPGGINSWDSLGFHNCDCNATSSLKEFKATSNMQVFPNPVYNGNLMIYSLNEIEAVEVYNITGHLIYQKQKMFNRGSAIINLKEQPSGVYILRAIFTNNQSDHRKILVQ